MTEPAVDLRDEARWPRLGIPGFSYPDLHDALRLADLTAAFDRDLHAADPELFARFEQHRRAPLSGPAEGDLLVELSGHLSRFVGRLFGVLDEQASQRTAAGRDGPLFRVKREFVQRRVFKKGAPDRPGAEEFPSLDDQVQPLLVAAARRDPRASLAAGDPELVLALVIDTLLDAPRSPEPFRALCQAMGRGLADRGELPERARELLAGRPELAEHLLDLFDRWCYAATLHPWGRHRTHGWSLLRLPRALDFQQLVPLRRRKPYETEGLPEHQRRRDGFQLTDPRATPREARSEIDYCIYCHGREKDSCSKGFREKESERYKKNPLGIPLTGCPLEERISEMHLKAREGDTVAALALVCIDNPMAPGTGHRICNDCMKACVYQKQDPVNIPQIETRVLTDALRLPWGYEIWSLLTRWNPLRVERPHPRPYCGVDVLVVGMGPAGYTLAHHLLNEGFGVVGVDGLKIEPLDPELVSCARAVENYDDQFGTPLDERVLSGFGGVSEYGITARWDKSFLDVLHLNLARRKHFKLYGGTRFGGTLTVDDAWALGFRHVALAAGAGRPTLIGLKNNLLRGVRKASDFLMALQLTGAFKDDALANLQVRLPAVVIGGGLTAIDTATELKAYYPAQVEKLLDRHEVLCESAGEEMVFSVLDPEERHVYAELLEHGRAVRAERDRAAGAGEEPDFTRLVAQWGGVTIAYRKGLTDSPAYRLNHEEVAKCLEEGIVIAEGLSPVEAVPDPHGAVKAVRFALQKQVDGKWTDAGEAVELPARTVCVAAGTSPNVTLEKESPGGFELDARHGSFRPYRLEGGQLVPAAVTDDLSGEPGFFTSYRKDGRLISFFGDNHPTYAGSVVKAMASAKDGHPHIARLFAEELSRTDASVRAGAYEGKGAQSKWHALTARLDDELGATVHEVRRLTPTIVEVVVRAKAAARRFRGGDGPHRRALDHPARRGRGALRRRPGQRGALQHLQGAAVERLPGGVLRRLQARAGRVQARRDRGGDRRGGLVHRRGRRSRAAQAAGPRLLWQHRAGDGGLRDREAGPAADPVRERPARHRHRIGPDDGGGDACAARGPPEFPPRRSRRHRVHQLADAMHDEGDLRAVPAEAPRPADRQGIDRLHLLRSGPADGPHRLGQPARAPAQQFTTRKALGAVAGPATGDEQVAPRLTRPLETLTAIFWGVEGGASSPLVEAPEAPDRRA